jgi:hypothetical protein
MILLPLPPLASSHNKNDTKAAGIGREGGERAKDVST